MGVIGNKMEKLNFEEINRMIAAVHEMERDFQFIFQDRPGQEEKIRELSAEILAGQAKESLKNISVEELKKSKSGIRVSALEEAGYEDIGKLSGAADWELKAIDGIGDKQIAACRRG